jgi:hypothetical protein
VNNVNHPTPRPSPGPVCRPVPHPDRGPLLRSVRYSTCPQLLECCRRDARAAVRALRARSPRARDIRAAMIPAIRMGVATRAYGAWAEETVAAVYMRTLDDMLRDRKVGVEERR